MNALENAQRESFVLINLANRNFALPAKIVAELAPPVRLHSFPHASPLVAGVIVRRGHILPVYDAARALSGKSSLAHRFYLVARREFGNVSEMSAIPVDGECELVSGEVLPPSADAPPYISGEIAANAVGVGGLVGVLDLEALVRAFTENGGAAGPSQSQEAHS
jgi:chemotaxis signal transduction protein